MAVLVTVVATAAAAALSATQPAAAAASSTTQSVAAATQPAAAAVTPWLSIANGYASFSVPADAVQAAMGTVAGVVVESNFGPSFNISEQGLSKNGNAWTSVIGPLPAGSYQYRFRGDGSKIMKDSTNPTTVTSDPTWSTFVVAGDSAKLLTDVAQGKGGAVTTVSYPGTADKQQSVTVWTPPGYDPNGKRRYPTLYLLSGEGGAATDWIELGYARQILDNLAVAGRIKPMVVVMADGTAADLPRELRRIRRAVGSNFRLANDSDQRAVAGISDAGTQVLRAALTDPGEYNYVGSFSGALTDKVRINAHEFNRDTDLLRLYTGNPTDAAYNPTFQLTRTLRAAKVHFEFDGTNPQAGHVWKAWQDNLADFAPRLFGRDVDPGVSAGHLPIKAEFTTPAAGSAPTPWLNRDSAGNTYATFETGTEYAAAKRITVWGNWAPGGSWVNVPMVKSGDRWRLTVGPLKPWFYYYQFIVDTVYKKDTTNPQSITTEKNWSPFLVPGPAARLLMDVPAGKGGTVDTLTYTSTVANAERKANVWLPPGYDAKRAQPYPVLYLQHGGGQNYTDWLEMGRAKQILDNEYLDGKLVPMVVVMGNGNSSDFTKELLDNIVPAARGRYNISHDAAQQALAGLSMGGFQTYDVLRTNPGAFAYIGTFSSGVFNWTGFDAAAINKGTKLLRIYCGDVTDFAAGATASTMATFDTMGIKYEFAGVTVGPHGWDVWQKNLIDFAPRLFQPGAS